MLKIGHIVKLPGILRGPTPKPEEPTIQVTEELETVPGAPQNADTVNYYTRNYPIESHNVENFVYRKWTREVSDIKETRNEHERLNKPLILASAKSGDVEPTSEPVPGKDVNEAIKQKALELGFGMAGIAPYDQRYTYVSEQEELGQAVSLGHLRGHGAALRGDPDDPERTGGGRRLCNLQARGGGRAGAGGLHTVPWLPGPGT